MVGRWEWLLRLVPPFRRTLDEIRVHAAEWKQRAAELLAGAPEGDPLWVVLGDSTAQAVGLVRVQDGYVERVRVLLESRDGRPWRVLNLSRSGAVLADVLAVQLPRLADLQAKGWQPALVSAVAGANDLRRTPAGQLLAEVPRLIAAVPAGTVVATLPKGIKAAKAVPANALIRRLAAGRGLPVVDLWAATGPPWRGKYADGLHPNAAGVTDWVAAFAAALDLPPEVDPPQVSGRGHRGGRGRRPS